MKVLHIGNIANNAYLNAKILNKYGIKSDVLSRDYYHIMGCPEWEDADFVGDYGDDNLPSWNKVDLKGFKSPSWFVKGNELLAINCLISKNQGKNSKKMFFEFVLEKVNFLFQKQGNIMRFFISKILNILRKVLQFYRKYLYKLTPVLKVIFFPLYLLYRNRMVVINHITNTPQSINFRIAKREETDEFKLLHEKLDKQLKKDFPERYEYLDLNYICIYEHIIKTYKKLFESYDVIIGYGLDGLYPLLAGKKYIAFEHGTLRNFPFQNDDLGLRALLSYKYADGVIITNADNIQAAKKLDLKNCMFIPHPINESPLKLLSTMDYDNLYEKYNTDFIAFHPSRQHWEKDIRHPDWEKGNDIFIEGFAKFVKEVNPKAKSIFIEWGQKVCESKELIQQLGIEENIVWIKPLHNYAMIRTILSSDVVADQFYLGAFGSTTPKALMCGKPAMLYLNESLHEWCFDEMPPVLNTASSEDVFDELAKLYADINFAKKLSFDSKNWYMKYHSNKLIKDRLVKMIDNILKNKNEDL